jgi:hypothetical protein
MEAEVPELSKPNTKLPPEQEAIRAKCFRLAGTFVELKPEEIEQSIVILRYSYA